MHTDPKRDAEKTEEAGFTGISEEAPSRIPSVQGADIPLMVPTPAQGPVRPPTPSRQDRLDLERSAGEGMTPPSKP